MKTLAARSDSEQFTWPAVAFCAVLILGLALIVYIILRYGDGGKK